MQTLLQNHCRPNCAKHSRAVFVYYCSTFYKAVRACGHCTSTFVPYPAGYDSLPGSGQLHAGKLHTARMKLRTCSVQCEFSLTASRSRCLNPHVGGAGGGIRHAFLWLLHSAHFHVRSGACPAGFAKLWSQQTETDCS